VAHPAPFAAEAVATGTTVAAPAVRRAPPAAGVAPPSWARRLGAGGRAPARSVQRPVLLVRRLRADREWL